MRGIVIGCFLLLWQGSAHASDQILVLSGGGSPAINYYSQYLQTKTLSESLRANLTHADVSVFFAAGNSTGESPLLADVHRIIQTSQGPRSSMTPGWIAANQPATKLNVATYFTGPEIKSLKPSDTLFLLVSDHGMPNRDENSEIDRSYANNCINLWGFTADSTNQSFKTTDLEDHCFSKDELKEALDTNARSARIVFAMSQCYSGGFHRLSVDTTGSYPSANPRICGFTAVTEDATASGCTPEVDGPGYQGYERFFTEQLTGLDVVKGQRLRPPRASIEEAHREAALQDLTVDIPISTSDFYLKKWFEKIMSRSFVPRTKKISAAAARNVALEVNNPTSPSLANRAYVSKAAFFQKMLNTSLQTHPEYRSHLNGSLDDVILLQKNLEQRLSTASQTIETLNSDLSAKLGLLYSKWNTFVVSGKSNLTREQSALETHLFYFYDLDVGFGMGERAALHLMSIKGVSDPAATSVISDYIVTRANHAIQWALESGNAELATLARQVRMLTAEIQAEEAAHLKLAKRQALVRRVLIYRQVLGAWNALVTMNDTAALAELQGLLECEKAVVH